MKIELFFTFLIVFVYSDNYRVRNYQSVKRRRYQPYNSSNPQRQNKTNTDQSEKIRPNGQPPSSENQKPLKKDQNRSNIVHSEDCPHYEQPQSSKNQKQMSTTQNPLPATRKPLDSSQTQNPLNSSKNQKSEEGEQDQKTKNQNAQKNDSKNKELIQKINDYRASKKLDELNEDPKLNKAAQVQSDHMAKTDTISHNGPPNQFSLQDRIRNAGGNLGSTRENVAQVNDDHMEALPMWIKSGPHNDNLTATDVKKIGLAITNGKNGKKYIAQVATN
ncbi:hypothetical protein GVAV_001458 [Gurleya vavrai]